MTDKNPVGRPPGSAKYTKWLHVRVKPGDREIIKEAAREAGLKVAQYVREKLGLDNN